MQPYPLLQHLPQSIISQKRVKCGCDYLEMGFPAVPEYFMDAPAIIPDSRDDNLGARDDGRGVPDKIPDAPDDSRGAQDDILGAPDENQDAPTLRQVTPDGSRKKVF